MQFKKGKPRGLGFVEDYKDKENSANSILLLCYSRTWIIKDQKPVTLCFIKKLEDPSKKRGLRRYKSWKARNQEFKGCKHHKLGVFGIREFSNMPDFFRISGFHKNWSCNNKLSVIFECTFQYFRKLFSLYFLFLLFHHSKLHSFTFMDGVANHKQMCVCVCVCVKQFTTSMKLSSKTKTFSKVAGSKLL